MFFALRVSKKWLAWTVVLMVLAGMFIWSRPAHAHTRIEAGNYAVVVGWEDEPVIVGQRNAVWLWILEGETPIGKEVKVDLEATVFYGGRSFLGFPAPSETPGVYLMDIIPTIRGTYELQLMGKIGDTEVEAIVELDEVQPGSLLEFPEAQPDPAALQKTLEETQAQLRTANMLALLGLGAGVIGIGLALFSLFRRSKT